MVNAKYTCKPHSYVDANITKKCTQLSRQDQRIYCPLKPVIRFSASDLLRFSSSHCAIITTYAMFYKIYLLCYIMTHFPVHALQHAHPYQLTFDAWAAVTLFCFVHSTSFIYLFNATSDFILGDTKGCLTEPTSASISSYHNPLLHNCFTERVKYLMSCAWRHTRTPSGGKSSE